MLMHLADKVLAHRLADSPSSATAATVGFGNQLYILQQGTDSTAARLHSVF